MDFCKRNKSADLQKTLWMLLLNFNFLGSFAEVILKKKKAHKELNQCILNTV